jgi:hypothetical protein
MKRRWIKATGIVAVVMALLGAYWLGARHRSAVCEVRRSPLDSQTIEVWRNGELTDEWQPEDGAIYTMLDSVLRDEVPPEAQQRARDRLNGHSQPEQPPRKTAPVITTGAVFLAHTMRENPRLLVVYPPSHPYFSNELRIVALRM